MQCPHGRRDTCLFVISSSVMSSRQVLQVLSLSGSYQSDQSGFTGVASRNKSLEWSEANMLEIDMRREICLKTCCCELFK